MQAFNSNLIIQINSAQWDCRRTPAALRRIIRNDETQTFMTNK